MLCALGTHLTYVLRATMTSYAHPLINQPLKGKYMAFYLYVISIGCIWNIFCKICSDMIDDKDTNTVWIWTIFFFFA